MPTVEFLDDPQALLDVAGEHLSREPLVSTVITTVTARYLAQDRAGVEWDPLVPRWWAVLRQDGAVVGVAMRTATGAPYPLYVLPMPDEAATALGRALVDRGEDVTAANGSRSATMLVLAELARARGGRVEIARDTRLFELGELVPPERRPSGRLRPAGPADTDLCLAWFLTFLADADEQAGRPRGTSPDLATVTRPDLERRIADGTVWLWEEADGTVVHLTAGGPPEYGVARIGPVYTPAEHRGRGYASAAVAEVSALLRAAGDRVCLFTDLANPTSNTIYESLGYRGVADMAESVLIADPVSAADAAAG